MEAVWTLRVYDTYNFIDGTVIDGSDPLAGFRPHPKVGGGSIGLAPATIYNWFGGRTTPAGGLACSAFMGALGYGVG
jgi:hypothetical protein